MIQLVIRRQISRLVKTVHGFGWNPVGCRSVALRTRLEERGKTALSDDSFHTLHTFTDERNKNI